MGKRSRGNQERQSPAPPPKPGGLVALLSRIKPGWAVFCVLVGGAFTFIVQSDDFFKNLQKLPTSADSTWSKYQKWVYEDDEWQGEWSTDVEYYVDLESMGLAGDARIDIEAHRGDISGLITTRSVCKELPMLGAVMIEGSVFGDRATVRAFDYVGGREVTFGKVRLKRDGAVIQVVPIDDRLRLFQQPIRVAKDVSAAVGGTDAEKKSIFDFCRAEKMEALMKVIRPAK